MKLRWLGASFILVLLLLALWQFWPRGGATPPALPDEGARVTVTRGDLAAVVEATGRVEAERQVRLSLPVGGVVASVAVEVGDEVAEGEALLTVEATELRVQVQEAESALTVAEAQWAAGQGGSAPAETEAAQAQLRAAQLALSVAEARLDALPEAERSTSTEAVAVEEARAGLALAQAALRRLVEGVSPAEQAALAAQVAQARARFRAAQAALEGATLRAPFAGTLTERAVSVGERAAPSQLLLALADLETLVIAADVDEVDVGRVAVGQAVTVTLDAFPTRPLAGEVARIAPASDSQRGATVYRTVIRFDPANVALRLDMAADVRIRTADATNALLLPLTAIRYAETQPYVLVRRNGQSVPQEVVLGAQDERMVVILEGLAEGEVVEGAE